MCFCRMAVVTYTDHVFWIICCPSAAEQDMMGNQLYRCSICLTGSPRFCLTAGTLIAIPCENICSQVFCVIPPRTTGVGRGFPTFRAGSSIIYRCSLNLVHLSAERETTSRPTVDRCGGIAATDRNFCLFRDTRSLTDSGSY